MRPRYSLRTIWLVTTVIAVYLGVMIPAVRTQRKAIDALRKVGGTVEYNGSPENLSGIAKWFVTSLGPDWLYMPIRSNPLRAPRVKVTVYDPRYIELFSGRLDGQGVGGGVEKCMSQR